MLYECILFSLVNGYFFMGLLNFFKSSLLLLTTSLVLSTEVEAGKDKLLGPSSNADEKGLTKTFLPIKSDPASSSDNVGVNRSSSTASTSAQSMGQPQGIPVTSLSSSSAVQERSVTNTKKRSSDDSGTASAKKPHTSASLLPIQTHAHSSTSTTSTTLLQSVPPTDPVVLRDLVFSTDSARFERVVGNENHIGLFVRMIDASQKSLDVVCWKLGSIPPTISNSLQRAASRGVKVNLNYLSLNASEWQTTDKIMGSYPFPHTWKERKTHTKCVVVDGDKQVIIGSFNFIDVNPAFQNVSLNDDENASIHISADPWLIRQIFSRIDSDITAYDDGQSPLIPVSLRVILPELSRFELMTNLEQHENFYHWAVGKAKREIIIYSPFITPGNALKRLKEIENNASDDVDVYIYIKDDYVDEENIEKELSQCPGLGGRNILKKGSFHRKTLIIDPRGEYPILCEGSFNWLSASTDISNPNAVQETSVVFSGPIARHLLTDSERRNSNF